MKKLNLIFIIVLALFLGNCSVQNAPVGTSIQVTELEFNEEPASDKAYAYNWWTEKAPIPPGYQIISFGYKRESAEFNPRGNVYCPFVLAFVPDGESTHSGMYYWLFYHKTDNYWFAYWDFYASPRGIYPVQSTGSGLANLMSSGEIYRWWETGGSWYFEKDEGIPQSNIHIEAAPVRFIQEFYRDADNIMWKYEIIRPTYYFDLDDVINGNLRDMAVGFYYLDWDYPDYLTIVTDSRKICLTYRDASGDHWQVFNCYYVEPRQVAMRHFQSDTRFDGLHLITNTRIYKYNGNSSWSRLSSLPSGNPKHLTVDEYGCPWIINSTGKVYALEPY